MNLCQNCKIKEKIRECCSSHPETGESTELILRNGRKVYACPNLSPDGECLVYDARPEICQEHLCYKFYDIELS